MGHALAKTYYLLAFSVIDKQALELYYSQPNSPRLDATLQSLYQHKHSLIFIEYDSSFTIMIPYKHLEDKKELEKLCNELLENLCSFFKTRLIIMGVSEPQPLENFQQAYAQARKALSLCHIGSNKKRRIQYYSQLGLLRLISEEAINSENVFINELIDNYIKPLRRYDEEHSTELYQTIDTYFSSNQSIKESSELLFIHVNTLRSRLNRVEQILDLSLSNVEDVLSLQIALKIDALLSC